MDKNTITGFLLITAIIVVFALLNRPNQEMMEKQKRYNDSVALIQKAKAETEAAIHQADSLLTDSIAAKKDSSTIINDAYGDFSVAAHGEEKFFTLENEVLKLTFTNKGARIYSAELKKYRRHDSLPLILFQGEESNMGFTLVTNNNRILNTKDLYFEPVQTVKKDKQGNQTIVFRLKTNGDGYMDIAYTLPQNNYMFSFGLKAYRMNNIMPAGTNFLEMQWSNRLRQQEQGRQFENRYSTIQYKYLSDDVEKLRENKNDSKQIANKLKWIAFKDQFFSNVLIADDSFTSTLLESKIEDDNSPYLKFYHAEMTVPFDPSGKSATTFRMYLGPNKYNILASYDKGLSKDEKLRLHELIPLGWGIFGWINRYMVIPMFNFFNRFIGNYGIIILLMTIVIKIVIFPMTYKTYTSSAKMRVLKPEIDEIYAKIPPEKAMERQKAVMDLYSKVGVSPMSGCIPALLQIPILFAMFSFFPASIELRQQSFLWAKDLSTYDSILSWNAYIPLITPYFGNHLSLFCLLMTISSIISTKLNMSTNPTSNQPGGNLMKWMMYLMPVMFMFIFNNYSAALSYYYFLSTLITIIQTYVIRAMVDEKKLLAQLHAKRNEKKPAKKSSWIERMEKMQREQQKAMRNKR
ncbi:MAG: membrane protein insertase YidC [Bacteroidales bacterium]|nr:membrane protein insertase YidC [Bacteroidales bacterium]